MVNIISIFPIHEGNKWWYNTWQSISWAGGPTDYSMSSKILEIISIDSSDRNKFNINKTHKYYPDSSVVTDHIVYGKKNGC